jgi:hypothetical protein
MHKCQESTLIHTVYLSYVWFACLLIVRLIRQFCDLGLKLRLGFLGTGNYWPFDDDDYNDNDGPHIILELLI